MSNRHRAPPPFPHRAAITKGKTGNTFAQFSSFNRGIRAKITEGATSFSIKVALRTNSNFPEETALTPQQLPSLTNSRLATAIAHPTRLHSMRVLGERVASPAEIAAEIGEPVNNVAYHIKILAELGCIELIEVKEARGGRVKEHLYRANQQPYFDDEAWAQLGESEKLDVVGAIMQQISRDVAEAMSHGTFLEPDDGHLSRTPLLVDQEGWREVNDVLAEALGKLLEVKENVTARNDGEQTTFPVKAHMMLFSSPRGSKESV